MSAEPESHVTFVLQAACDGDASARDQLLGLVYAELRRLAAAQLRRERDDHTLQPTALVHEAWIKLIDQDSVEWQGRAHFLGVASQAMRRVLIDHARTKKRAKRGGGWGRVELPDAAVDASKALDLLAIDEALTELASLSERQAKLVELRFFGGLTPPEAADVLGVSLTTAEREWRIARAWLTSRLAEQAD